MTFLRRYDLKQLKIDALAGVIIALVSIPISMGYAQVAGLPAAYGLYGSVFPILLFGLLSTSPRFVFGVDAAPAALCGGMLANMGIAAASPEALQIVPVLTLFVGLWLLVFHLLRAGSFVKYISSPVMGGFITGIGCEIILMQVPKLFGGRAGHGELPQLLAGIVTEAGRHFHGLSFVLGLATVAIILLCRTLVPRIPVNVIIMGVGAASAVEALKADEAWSGITAVKNGAVYANPNGVFSWDRYSGEEALQVLWAAKKFNPDKFADVDIEKETKDFYMQYYGYQLTDDECSRILNGENPA